MPSVARVLLSVGVAVTVGLVFFVWLGWTGFLAVGVGAVFGISFLVAAASVGDDPRAADAAWRAQAGDLIARQPRAPDDELPGLRGPTEFPKDRR